ncbi:winged helix-turn-helix transcriptional regulator [Microtetraspora sp. AC03309]|uniref:ArsR/SmtB family transcription factor n=1 Tax=Microtetraspora sp. AC03309 TaxID=2779376 RepID=UPI001E649272|nr:winged helix-turn-helix domain-containing protein [Microtetraspora sp. AC03309]MCC5574998.1 winged helix-turn-helix transcriptional regulator [Microtetraspora sp. AC03309]
MTSTWPEGSRQVTDAGVLRALAHPARLAILSRLQTEGPATATECAEVTGLSPSACSYHLRQLAKHGFVADAPPRGDGRERVWRALQRSWGFQTPEVESPDIIEAQNAVIESVLAEADQRLRDYLDNSDQESREWKGSAWLTHGVLRVDAEELREIAERINEVIRPYRVTERDPGEAPTGARLAEIHLRMFPRTPRRRDPAPEEAAKKAANGTSTGDPGKG